MYKNYNPNPFGSRVGDCTVRAISKATGNSWVETYLNLCVTGLLVGDMPSANSVWGKYLKEQGFTRELVKEDCDHCYTVEAFCKEHPVGKYILCTNGHVVCVIDGDYYDSWDSGNEIPIYYWKEKY